MLSTGKINPSESLINAIKETKLEEAQKIIAAHTGDDFLANNECSDIADCLIECGSLNLITAFAQKLSTAKPNQGDNRKKRKLEERKNNFFENLLSLFLENTITASRQKVRLTR